MGYVRLDDQIGEHVKVLRAGPAAAWMWAMAIAYSNRRLTDGFIPTEQIDRLTSERGAAATKMAARCVDAGLFQLVEGGYQVHDYLTWNPSRDKVEQDRAAAAQRKAASRNRHAAPLSQRDTDGTPAGHERGLAGARATPTKTPTKTPTNTHTEGARVVRMDPTWGAFPGKRKPHCAWESAIGLNVLNFLHDEFTAKLTNAGTSDVEATLYAWYAETEAAYKGKKVGEDAPKFWRARFAEWQGTSAATLAAVDDWTPPVRTGGAR